MRRQIAFSVSAGAYVYQMGVGCYLQRHYDLSDCFFSGASGGAWVALLLAAGKDVKVAFDIMLGVAHRLFDGRLLGSYLIYDKAIEESFHLIFQGQDVPSLVNGRLSIVVTRLCWSSTELFKQEIIDHWTSNEDVLQCIIASALIPYALNGKPFVKYRGWHCLDGGVTNIEGINQAWALAHKRTASLMSANGEGYLRSIEDMMEGLTGEADSGARAGSDAVVPSGSGSVMWRAIRWVPFADYMINTVSRSRTTAKAKKAVAGEETGSASARPPTHLIGFVGTVARLTVGMVAEQVTYPIHATMRTVAGMQRSAWQLTHRVYQTTEGVAVQLHETLPLKSLRERMLSLVMTRDTALMLRDSIVGPESSTAAPERKDKEDEEDEEAAAAAAAAAGAAVVLESQDEAAATKSLHDRLGKALEAMLSPWQLGRAASHTLTKKLKDTAEKLTTNIFGLLSMPEFSFNDLAEVEGAHECADMLQEELDLEAADGESVAAGGSEDYEMLAMSELSDLSPRSPPHPSCESSAAAASAAPAPAARPSQQKLRSAVSDSSAMSRKRECTCESRCIAPCDGHAFDHTAFWGEHHRDFVVKTLPNGGKRLELAPWSWRKHNILTYHLSADLGVNRKLFGLGILDAEAHHWEMHEFFE